MEHKKVMLDLFVGLGGASNVFRKNGWQVYGLDNDPRFNADFCCDIKNWVPPEWLHADFVWASVPCTEYSRFIQRGLFPDEPLPDMTLYHSAKRIIEKLQPAYYVIECVRGAVRFFGDGYRSFGPYYLWTNLPDFGLHRGRFKYKKGDVTKGHALRASYRSKIPWELSCAIYKAVSDQGFLFPMPQIKFMEVSNEQV